MRTQEFEKRLTQIERKIDPQITYSISYPDAEDSAAWILSGYQRKKYTSALGKVTYDIDWAQNMPPATDSLKRKWIGQHSSAMIESFRQRWAKSEHERDRIALKELDRLMPSEDAP
jgi:hypothetical protein